MSSYDKVKPSLGLGPNGHTQMKQSADSKQIKCDCHMTMGTPAEIGKTPFITANKTAPSERIYNRDYTKVGRERDETDLVRPALGNPLIW
jgi:hypothetical protein